MDRGVAGRHDYVHLALDQPRGENVEGPGLSLAERILAREVPPLDIAKLAQGAAPRLQVRFGELSGASPEHSDARHFVHRLRLDSERRSEEAHGQEDREDAPRNCHTSPHSKSRWFSVPQSVIARKTRFWSIPWCGYARRTEPWRQCAMRHAAVRRCLSSSWM